MMFFCIGIQVLSIVSIWVLLWRRNVARSAKLESSDVPQGFELGLQDVTDKLNPYFKVSASKNPKLTRRHADQNFCSMCISFHKSQACQIAYQQFHHQSLLLAELSI